MACNNCFDNCPGYPLSDKCVKYTGEDIDALGICYGDTLYSVEVVILEKLQEALDGTGIELTDSTLDCQFLVTLLEGKDKTLANIIQLLLDASCSLRALIEDIEEVVNSSTVFDLRCLDISTSSTRDQIIQGIINKLCTVDERLTTIEDDYVKNSQLCSLVTACISGSASTQESAKMPKYVALPYHGPMSVFDSAGSGISSSGYDKVYLCIGQTIRGFTLPDYRGRSPVGANVNVPTSGMDTVVNPALPQNAAYGITVNQKKGAFSDTLTSTQIPSHTHSITDPGHDHLLNGHYSTVGDDNNLTLLQYGGSDKTGKSTTGITINNTGGGQAHNTLHPGVGANMIMFVP